MTFDDLPSSYQKRKQPPEPSSSTTTTSTSGNVHMANHMKTYTAGEDGSRLAEMAKQFGLENQRQPRKQIRDEASAANATGSAVSALYRRAGTRVKRVMQDHSMEVARMRAGYSRERHTSASSFHDLDRIGSDRPLLAASSVAAVGADARQPQRRQQSRPRRASDGGIAIGLAGGDFVVVPLERDMPDWMAAIELEEEDLHAVGVGGDLTSAVLGIIKGMVGPAILYLPHGLAKSGYALAIPIMLLVTFMFLFSSQCLLDSWRLEHNRLLQEAQDQDHFNDDNADIMANKKNAKNGRQDTIEEGDENDDADDESKSLLVKTTNDEMPHHKRTFFLSYPELAYRALGYQFEKLVKLGITLMQSCVCLTYLIFVPQNLSSAVKLLWGISIPPEWFLIVMILIQVPLSWIRDIRKLTATNLLANLLILYGLIVCIVLALKQATTTTVLLPADERAQSTTYDSPIQILAERFHNLDPFGKEWFLFIGTAVFMFEGSITVLVPLQEAVFTEEDRQKFPAVNRNTVLCIIAFYIFFSITCWMALGDDVRTVLTTSLPAGPAATTVQLAYSVAVIFTFPLQNYPALEIVCRSVSSAIDNSSSCKACHGTTKATLQHNLISSAMVVLLAVVAVATMESLDKVVSFLGGLLGCPIAFIFPPLIHLKLAGRTGTLSSGRKVMDILVALMGIVAMILSTMTTLLSHKK